MSPRLELLVATRRDFGTDLAGAARADERWQARRQGLRPPTSTWIGSRRRRPVPGARSASEMRDRRRAELGEIKEELRRRLHQPIPEQGDWLKQVVSGFNACHAAPTNGRAPGVPRTRQNPLVSHAEAAQPAGQDGVGAAEGSGRQWLSEPLILYPWPSNRFAVEHPRRGDLGRKVQKPSLDYRGRLLLSHACRCMMAAAGVPTSARAGVIPIGLSTDLIDGLGDPGIAGEGGKPSGFVT